MGAQNDAGPPPLTPAETHLMTALIEHIADEHVPPTYDELCEEGMFVSRAFAHRLVQQLVKKGYIRKDERLTTRNIWPLRDTDGRPFHTEEVVNAPSGSRAEQLLRACVPVLVLAANELEHSQTQSIVLKMAQGIQAHLRDQAIG